MPKSIRIRADRRLISVLAGGALVCLVLYLAVLSPLQSAKTAHAKTLNALNAEVAQLNQRESQGVSGGNSFSSLYQKDLQLDQLIPHTLSETQVFTLLSSQITAAGLTIDNFSSTSVGTLTVPIPTTSTTLVAGASTTTTLPQVDPSSGSVPGANALAFSFEVSGTLTQVSNWTKALYNAPNTLTTTTDIKMTLGNQGYTGSQNVQLGQVTLSGNIYVWYATSPGLTTSSTSTTTTTTTLAPTSSTTTAPLTTPTT